MDEAYALSQAKADAGRVVLVTGAGKGLGAAFATAWARRGASVVVNNRHGEDGTPSAERIAAMLRSEGHKAIADLHPVDDRGAADAIVASAIAAYGRLDAIILNAGVNGPAAKVADLDDAAIRDVMDINFHANTALVRAALPFILASPTGRILFVSSSAGLHGVRGRAAYAASKSALNGYALTVADELRRDGVGVNVLLPYAATTMTTKTGDAPNPALAPALAAPAAVWLTGAACRETGTMWIAGGGQFRRARTMESLGGGIAAPTPEWLAANSGRLSDMAGARSYPGAEAAFADFYADCISRTKESGDAEAYD